MMPSRRPRHSRAGRAAAAVGRLWAVGDEPDDDMLLGPAEVAAWLDVDEDWLARSVTHDELPVMGWTSDGRPIVIAGEVRAWLRRPDPQGDHT
jgi:hypothetical protein